MSAEKLYSPELLAAAVELANYPPLEDAAHHGSARSTTCGSTLDIDIDIDEHEVITRFGMRVRACAVGQASASLFARHAMGLTLSEVSAARDAIAQWLQQGGALPAWPGLALVEPARDFPGRHGAMLLPWKAAVAALSTSPASS